MKAKINIGVKEIETGDGSVWKCGTMQIWSHQSHNNRLPAVFLATFEEQRKAAPSLKVPEPHCRSWSGQVNTEVTEVSSVSSALLLKKTIRRLGVVPWGCVLYCVGGIWYYVWFD